MRISAKILVVDDSDLVRRMVCSLLTQQSHWKIYQAENGKVALDEILEIRPDVVILDIVMPEMNGLEAAYRIRQLAPETKVILMSSYYTDERAVTLNRLFGDGNFMQKSEIATELVPAISRLLFRQKQA